MNAENPYEPPEFRSRPARVSPPLKRNLRWLLFSFRGRIGRATYWGTSLGSVTIFCMTAAMLTEALGDSSDLAGLVGLVLYTLLVWVSMAIQAKRWHDRDKSGWFFAVNFIPVLGPLWAFVELGFLEGTPGENRFGEDAFAARVADDDPSMANAGAPSYAADESA